MEITPEAIDRALQIEDFDALAAQRQMAPIPRQLIRLPEQSCTARLGGVLLLLYARGDRLFFVLTRRTESVETHQGQISLPGGAQEVGETLAQTAAREAEEEIGVSRGAYRLVGRLTSLYIPPSDFEVHPFVAYCPSEPGFAVAPAEVAELLHVPLACLLASAVHRHEEWTIRGYEALVPFYQLNGHKVWGATAMILSEFEQRLRRVVQTRSEYACP
jgi:8-oxo-dGTP pyrophosphatase MutT (NUDIX family)